MTTESNLPDGVLLAFYGDDFTGSTDAMEVTARAGLRTVLFTRAPDAGDLVRFADYRVIGVAGTARSHDPAWMEEHLTPILERLAALNPPILQYKVCSTFDSAPEIGSIGKAIRIGRRFVSRDWSPSIVGAPQLGRWQVFGNLFAAAHGVAHRIDRHPTMSRHPVTPMLEGDLRYHLSLQLDDKVASVDLGDMTSGRAAEKVRSLRETASVAFIDVAEERTQREAGQMVWESRDGTLFSASSSGLQYALVAYWRAAGLLPQSAPELPAPPPIERLLVLSGSCSPVTSQQIDLAEKAGFATIPLDVTKGMEESGIENEADRVLGQIRQAHESARGVLVYAARNVDDQSFATLRTTARSRGLTFAEAQDRIGRILGRIAHEAVVSLGLRRLVVAGGDTSGRVLEAMPVKALEMKNPLSPGAPLCHAHSDDDRFDGLELVLKGGQLGSPDLFVRALGEDQAAGASV